MPDTTGPFYAAYIITAVVYGGYALSIWLRAKKTRENVKTLEHSSHRPG